MENQPSPEKAAPVDAADSADYVTFKVGGQLFGIPVLKVQDILVPDKIASVPLAPQEIRGSINLRGRIATVLDMRARLGLTQAQMDAQRGHGMGVTVEKGHELYTLLVDSVGDVISLSRELFEANLATLDRSWVGFAEGIFRLKEQIMVVLNTDRLLDIRANA
jgi:purine-binding chemotaxis protein CheW